jgi:cytochrome c oxidase subunit I
VTGVLMGTMQLNMLIHNTLFTVGHFHATVVSGTTLAFMGISYYLIPLLSQRKLVGLRVARWQPYVFGGGVALLTTAMLLAGQLGVPRRVAQLGYADAPLTLDQYAAGPVTGVMALVSLGAVFAVVGGIMFIYVMAMTLLRGERTETPDAGLIYAFGPRARRHTAESGVAPMMPATGPGSPDDAAAAERTSATMTRTRAAMHVAGNGLRGKWATFEAPGTYVLVLIFLAWFVGFYVIAHLNLSRSWPVG